MKKALSAVLLVVLILSSSTTSIANAKSLEKEVIPSSKEENIDDSIDSFTFDKRFLKTIVKDKISFAKQHNIPLSEDGKPIKKIEIEYVPATINEPVQSNNASIEPMGILFYVGQVTDHGSGWYNSSDDLYADITTSGPDTLVISKTVGFEAKRTGHIGVGDSELSGEIGFEIGRSYSVTFSSTTPVAKGERLNVKAYTTYLKKECWIYEKVGLQYVGTTWTYKPNGAYFVKTWY
ncbi:hypothetical protein EDD66_10477 [Mobilisporobacter senegalensis]|uniref:Uncharacterized protein n=1 Tax=Mobilisporobacter senegalensis TaxID=1329262 RepID=A0A3N1XPA8_9FIRM|nr:hypothetical protein [Mobilisporobacter senegalensis]ROR28495.1 hypothetical protein EDD66_10477 [Mobilisporobacter senegalensis]